MISDWKTVSVSEIIDEIAMGPFGSNIKVECFTNDGIPVLNGSNLIGSKLKEDSFKYVSEEKADSLKKANAYRGDIVITHRGTLGQIVYIPSNSKHSRYVISQSQFRIRCNVMANPKYIVYYFHSKEGQFKLLSNKSQVGVPALARPTSTFKCITFPLPPLAEQKAIADTLSALDDKIELNNKINKNLEEMAQAIFKSWFVDFEPFKDGEFVDSELGRIPKGWRVVELGDIADITMGQSPNGSSYNETNNGTVFFQGRAEFGWRFPTKRLCTTEPKRYAEQGDILMSVRAPVGDINIALEKCCIGRGLSSISAKNNARSFLLYAVKNLKSRLNMFNSEGTVFGSINKDCLNGLSVIIPTFDLINKFELLVRPMDNKIEKNSIELCFLTTLRDTLLPKLMSGEIRVPYKEYAEVK